MAVSAGDVSLSYSELERHSNTLAWRLRDLLRTKESKIGICMGRNVELVVAILGVLKAGAAYVPLDRTYPEKRLRFLLKDSMAALILYSDSTKTVVQRVCAGTNTPTLLVDLDIADNCAEIPPPAILRGEDLAYLIYTSGSTGQPKAVQGTHVGISNLLRALEVSGVFDREVARVGWNASSSFDASIQQWLRLCLGDTLVLIDEQTRNDSERFGRFVAHHKLTEFDVTPSHLEFLLDHLPLEHQRDRPLRLLIGGEPISRSLWNKLRALGRGGKVEAYNLYGPTECTVDATFAKVMDHTEPTIGLPLPGTRVYVLDERLQPVADGSFGELFVAGRGVTRGYFQRPSLTAERFLPDSLARDGSRMYLTGDVGRYLHGKLELVGRMDRQIKLRGVRVEPG